LIAIFAILFKFLQLSPEQVPASVKFALVKILSSQESGSVLVFQEGGVATPAPPPRAGTPLGRRPNFQTVR
jgi:hypothetical protein